MFDAHFRARDIHNGAAAAAAATCTLPISISNREVSAFESVSVQKLIETIPASDHFTTSSECTT